MGIVNIRLRLWDPVQLVEHELRTTAELRDMKETVELCTRLDCDVSILVTCQEPIDNDLLSVANVGDVMSKELVVVCCSHHLVVAKAKAAGESQVITIRFEVDNGAHVVPEDPRIHHAKLRRRLVRFIADAIQVRDSDYERALSRTKDKIRKIEHDIRADAVDARAAEAMAIAVANGNSGGK